MPVNIRTAEIDALLEKWNGENPNGGETGGETEGETAGEETAGAAEGSGGGSGCACDLGSDLGGDGQGSWGWLALGLFPLLRRRRGN